MTLAVLTGPVRSGKSRLGLQLALASGLPVTVAVGAAADDEEMVRRIRRHQQERPSSVTVVETYDDPDWMRDVPPGTCLLVDCLGTVLTNAFGSVEAQGEILEEEAERSASAIADALVSSLAERKDPTVVVTNEVGWGVVPTTPLGRLFRDELGRANRLLVERADAAWLVVAGRCVDLASLEREVAWPAR